MAIVRGVLSDILDVPLSLDPELYFYSTNPATNLKGYTTETGSRPAGGTLFSTKPVKATVSASGYFQVDLHPTVDLQSVDGGGVWYRVRVEWVDETRQRQGIDVLEHLSVPEGGGRIGDIFDQFPPSWMVEVSLSQPPNPLKNIWWLNPVTGDLKRWNPKMRAYELISNMRGAQGPAGPASPYVLNQLKAFEAILAEPGTLRENLVTDPKPATAEQTYTPSRSVMQQDTTNWGRNICQDAGATSFSPVAAPGSEADSKFILQPGKKFVARVTVRAMPTVGVSATLIAQGYKWNGGSFIDPDVPVRLSSEQLNLPNGNSQGELELTGVFPDTDATHFDVRVQWRRFRQTYPNPGDYIDFRQFLVATGDAATSTTWFDGDTPGAWWTGPVNNSRSVTFTPRTGSGGGSSSRHEALLGVERNRRGGVIGVGNMPCVALRFDHHLQQFTEKILPHLKRLGLPWSETVNVDNFGNGNDNVNLTDLQTSAINTGGEITNHGGNHLDASGPALDDQIVGALKRLQAAFPKLVITQFNPPGIPAGGYEGFTPVDSVLKFTDTRAGRMVADNHAFASGQIPGVYRALDGSAPLGLVHSTLDKVDAQWVDGLIRGAIASKSGTQLMVHPNYLDQPGYITSADVVAILENIAARRDKGELLVLTASGLLMADAKTTERHNLADTWTGWESNGTLFSTTGNEALTATVDVSRQQQFLQGTRELSAQVRSTGATTVLVKVTSTNVNASHDVAIPANTWVNVTQPCVLQDLTTTLEISKISGPDLEARNLTFRPV